MAKQTSRELVLERRKALSQGGKNSLLKASTPSRIRSSDDARATRTEASFVKPRKTFANKNTPSSNHTSKNSTFTSSVRYSKASVSQPSRALVIERRQALSLRGKSADRSKDRTRVDVEKLKSTDSSSISTTSKTDHCCPECEEKAFKEDQMSTSSNGTNKSLTLIKKNTERRSSGTKIRAITNSSRAYVLARREALSKHGKSAGKQPTSPASVARQGNPDLTTREIAQRVRELRSQSGATGAKRSAVTRPCGPNRKGSKLASNDLPDANWKVGISETNTGQLVTGTQANRSVKTTGNESSTCRSITGTQYLGAEVFDTFCQTQPSLPQPLKVAVTNTTHGNKVTGNEVGRSGKVTGDEPGTCKNLTGTEYLSADQLNDYCGGANPTPRKVGKSMTEDGRNVTGVMVGRASNVTGDESGAGRHLTGDQYIGSEPLPSGRPAQKVGSLNTVRGSSVTGTDVSRSQFVTGNEPGSCKRVTGDEYVGSQQFDGFCGGKPQPEAAKVGLSVTNKSQGVSGTMTGRSELVTGDEPGTCKAVTGTPYAGLEQAGQWCNSSSINEIQSRTPKRLGTPGAPLTGQQPGIGGVMTGAQKGACEDLTGTPYIGSDQLAKTCGSTPNFQKSEDNHASQHWGKFSVQSPAQSARSEREENSAVTGTSYENSSRITGPFDMATNKVTGTEQFRFDRKKTDLAAPIEEKPLLNEDQSSRVVSRITGEGQSAGLNITGDDWARGERVTGTEGTSARRRNPSIRPGGVSAKSLPEIKRNEEISKPDFLITGSSGNTRDGQLVTFSGGARG